MLIAIYGIICFLFIFFYQDIPKDLRKYLKTSYTFFEYAVFAAIFYINIKQKKIKLFIVLISIIFLAFQFFYVLTVNVKRLDSVPIGIETILLLFYTLYFFYESFKDFNKSHLYKHYAFWIGIGILIYLGGSFFFFILIDQLTKDEINAFGNITYVTEIVKNILFITALYVYSKFSLKEILGKKISIPYLDHI